MKRPVTDGMPWLVAVAGSGPKLPSRNVRYSVAMGGKADVTPDMAFRQ
jgi:hypothetical protein